jgi:cell division septal protein divIB/ftsQ
MKEEAKKISNKKKNRESKKKGKIENKPEDDKFCFDNEIIIGVTRKQEPAKNKKEKKKVEKAKNKGTTKRKQVKKANKKSIAKNTKNIAPEQQEKIMQKRKKKQKAIKWILILALLIVAILCAMFSSLFNIKKIEVQGNEIISKNEIISLSQIQLEENTFKLNKSQIKKQIKENAYIQSVIIVRNLPSEIVIKVEERKPAYLLEYAGSYIVIDKQGYMLEIKNEKMNLPVIQGAVTSTEEFKVGNRLCTEDLEKLAEILRIVEIAQVNDIYTIITGIDIENAENIKLIFESEDKVAYLGDSSNMNTKILMIKSIIEKEKGNPGEIFLNFDLNKKNPIFRERV